jgi:hypothetical protein
MPLAVDQEFGQGAGLCAQPYRCFHSFRAAQIVSGRSVY